MAQGNKPYNPIFEKLVVNLEDNPDPEDYLVGKLAYSEYKEDKYYWKKAYQADRNVQEIPEAAVNDFLLTYGDRRLEKLKDDAREQLMVFAEIYAENQVKEAKEEAKLEALTEEIKRHRDGWWKAGFKGALGSFIFAAIVFVISALISLSQPDSNYARLFQFLIGNQEFVILPGDDCRVNDDIPCDS
jgi:hypothetical protein